MGTASRNSLSFVCLWTQKPRDDRESFVAAHKRFFEEALKGRATVSIERVQQKLPRHSCEDPLWQLHCRLSLHSSLNPNQLESLSTDIARQWCAGGVRTLHGSSGPLKWLQPDRRHGFWHGWLAMEANVKMRCVSFGTLPGDLTFFAERHTIESKFDGDGYTVDCTFKHDERVLQVFLECGRCSAAEGLYQLSMHYSNIFRVVVCDPVGGPTDIFLHVYTLPLFHKATGNVHPSVRGNRQATMDQMNFQRTLTIGCPCSSVLESRDIGGCFVMKLGFSDSHDARRTVGRLSRKCRRAWFQFAQVTTDRVGTKVDTLKEQLCSRLMPKLKFPCCYALNALLQRSDDIAVQLMLLSSEEFNSVLRNLELFAARNEGALEEALFGVGTALENHSIVTFATALPALFAQSCKTHVPCQVPRGSCLIRRLFVTPSRIFYLPPAVHSENRVLRKFDAGYALRVSFRDDHFEFLSYSLGCHPQKQEMMDKVVGSFLREGVKIGDRHFKLLASSVSQLRDHGVWLYADDPQGNTVESIREWMGDFSTLPNMAKKIARMGQCFSTTEESVTVPLHSETMEDAADIEGGTHPESGKPYVFSDGIGMISESLMEKVCSKLDLTEVPSAIQIRYAGYKGMLCMNNTLEGDKLILRKSMNKFACSTSDSLEVIKVSSPSPVFLNRPLITILEQLGVPGQVFLGLQQNMVLQLCDAFVSNETALNILCTYTNASLPFFKMHLRGLALSREPFTRSLLLVVYKSMIAGLQEKGRIAIPPERGRNMLGVLDETGTLEYGQVFVQYTAIGVRHGDTDQNGGGDAPTSNAKVLTGTVLVTKCPCLHPGDVRKFEAVDVPALRHIRDCIVFPAKGPRPHPNEMAGSDLDGDEYIVIWEKDLFFPGENREPMTFSDTSVGAPSTGDLNEDIIQFLCKYILNDSVGVMSNAHLAWADQLARGIFDPFCLTLARKISVCLDFAKTGISEALCRSERVHWYPDFMNKRGVKPMYRSSRVLGELYRLNKTLISSGTVTYTNSDFHSALFEYPGWQKHQEAAEKAKSTYAWLMSQILNQHGIESEAEVVTGVINSVSRYNKSKQDKSSVETLVAKQYRALVATMRQQFLADVEAACQVDQGSGDKKSTLLEMASAWYVVTSTSVWREENSLGLPWCIPENLLLLLRERGDGSLVQRPPAHSLLVAKIDTHCSDGSAGDVAFDMLCKWAQSEELLQDGAKGDSRVCKSCLKRTFEEFALGGKSLEEEPASSRDETSSGVELAEKTAGCHVAGFLRHLAAAPTELSVCTGCSSDSRQAHTLTLAALHCYSQLVISRDVCCFGLPCDADHDWAQEVQESDPIRINSHNGRFLEKVRGQPDTVRGLLCRWTGVQEVNIRCHSYRSKKYHYLVVSAVGRLWQLCAFEELVSQPWLENAIITEKPGSVPGPPPEKEPTEESEVLFDYDFDDDPLDSPDDSSGDGSYDTLLNTMYPEEDFEISFDDDFDGDPSGEPDESSGDGSYDTLLNTMYPEEDFEISFDDDFDGDPSGEPDESSGDDLLCDDANA